MKRAALLILAVAAALAPAGSAAGASEGKATVAKPKVPFVLGRGLEPNAAIAGNGIAHLVWNGPIVGTTPDALHYCRLPKGLASCSAALDLHPPGVGLSRPYVFIRGRDVFLVTHRCCYYDTGPIGFPGLEHTLLFESNDGGHTWPTTGREIGTLDPSGDGLLGPTAGGPASPSWSFLAVTGGATGGTVFQFGPYSPGTDANEQKANLGPAYWYHGSVGLAWPKAGSIYDSRPVVTFDDLEHTTFARYVGSGVFASLNVSADWTKPRSVGKGVEGRLAGGPSGLFLLLRVHAAKGDRYVVRRYKGTSFGAAHRISPVGEGELAEGQLVQGAGGRLYAVWRRLASGPDALRFTTSANGHAWAKPTTVGRSDKIFNARIGVGGGRGLAVWDENSNAPSGRILGVGIAGG
jgi:hypothetical protein